MKGSYVVWGNAGTSATGATLGAITAYHPNVSHNHTAKKKEITDGTGHTATVVYHDEQHDLTVECIPYDGTSEANAKTEFKLPAIGEVVTIACTEESSAGQIAGKYLYEGGSKVTTTEGEARMTLNLRRYVNAATPTLPAQT
jgi:hypothetical protein